VTKRYASLLRALKLILWLALLAAPVSAQTTGTIAPPPLHQFFDNSGDPCSGCKLYTYTAGTTTPASTYTDIALSIAHPNPIVMDSAGRPIGGNIYLGSGTFKFVMKTSADVTLWTSDNVASLLSIAVAAADNATCGVRLTLTSGTPVTTSNVTAATTVYVTPYKGSRCAFYDGTTWLIYNVAEISIALGSDAADTNWDVFLYVSSGSVVAERVAWTNSTTRATSITLQNGVYVKSTDTSHRYVGTYRTTGVAGQCEDSLTKRYVWNFYNRVKRSLRVTEATASWTYTTATGNEVNNTMANAVAVVVGVADALLDLTAVHVASNTNTGVTVSTGISEDITAAIDPKTPASGSVQGAANTAVANGNLTLVAKLQKAPTVGYHLYVWFEYSAATGTTTWLGVSTNILQTGVTGFIEG
jgi:hypothetical protein